MENFKITTGIEGTADFPSNANDVYSAIETLAVQNIRALKSFNKIVDGVFEYDISEGKVIEEAVIEMAQAQAFDKNSYNFQATDAVVKPLYFNNYEAKQFKTTIRRDDIRAIIANKGVGVDDVVSQILDTLSQGEGNYDFVQTRNLLYSANFKDYSSMLGGVPKTAKGIIYALRDMFNHLKANNSDLTNYSYVSSTPIEDIRIALSPKVLNLIDVVELASVFNLEKEELFGKLVVVDTDDMTDKNFENLVFVYDRKALGRATRIFDYTQDIIGVGRYSNHYLTTERAYFHNGLFKGCYLDCSDAIASAKSGLIDNVSTYSITKTLTQATTTSTATTISKNGRYEAEFVCNSGYTLDDASAVATVSIGGVDKTAEYLVVSADKKSAKVDIQHVGGNVVVVITAIEEEE